MRRSPCVVAAAQINISNMKQKLLVEWLLMAKALSSTRLWSWTKNGCTLTAFAQETRRLGAGICCTSKYYHFLILLKLQQQGYENHAICVLEWRQHTGQMQCRLDNMWSQQSLFWVSYFLFTSYHSRGANARFAFSERVLGEDLWTWGAARYNAVLYQTKDSTLRRVACKGSVWGSLPHGLSLRFNFLQICSSNRFLWSLFDELLQSKFNVGKRSGVWHSFERRFSSRKQFSICAWRFVCF